MGYTNSPLVVYTKFSPNHSGQRTHSIDRITPHCVVGQLSAESICGCFTSPDRQASCNYGIGYDGRVSLCVEERNRSWCTSSRENDQRAITIECASDKTHPYAFKDVVYNRLVELCIDICKRNGKSKLLWLGDKDKTLNYIPKSDEMVLSVHRWFANKSCVPVNSEVLTRNGWVKLRDINVGDEIACATLDGLRISFEEVLDKVEERKQDTYTSNGLTATMDHRMVYSVHQSKDLFRIDYYKRLLNSGTNIFIPMAGHMNADGLPLTDEMLTFLVAVQADGHYMYEKRVDGSKSYYGVEFHLRKERKIKRLISCLEACHFEYKIGNQSDGTKKIRLYNTEDVNIVKDVCELWLQNKYFTWEWLNLSEHQARLVLDEILLWDGCTAANLYTSKENINLDVISALAAINGVGSNVTGSNIQFRNNPYITLGEAKRNARGEQTIVSCVTVKTGIFLCRQNGKTFIIGNCPGDWMYPRMGDLASKVTAALNTGASSGNASSGLQATALKDLSEAAVIAKVGPLFTANQKSSGILASVSLAQFILESGYGKSELAQNANNCFGMKKSLSGNTWPGSAWDGTSIYKKETQEYENGAYVTITADFRKYACVEDSIADHSAYLLGAKNGSSLRYEGVAGMTDYKAVTKLIKDGGYATSPTYVDNLCGIIEKWNLTQYDVTDAGTGDDSGSQNSSFPAVPFMVKVLISDLNYRSEPSMDGKILGQTGKGTFTITKLSGSWGYLKSGAGWVYLGNPSYCAIGGTVMKENTTSSLPYTVKVSINDLNIRKGPGTGYAKTGKYTGKGVFTIMKESAGAGSTKGWGLLKAYAEKEDGWIALDYAERL